MAEDRKVKDAPVAGGTKKAGALNRFDNPWINWKFLTGAGILGFLFFLIFLGISCGIRTWRYQPGRR